uniref:AAA family ATPase n=1 Tax=Thermodesulfovibrio aggregans TaxID=86166 RepID=A0A7C4AJF6_9BACT
MNIDFNEEFLRAFHLAENTDRNLFITGRAGTGKSTFLRYFKENTKKEIAVLAPTGVAAVNVRGQTIHSFFNFKPDITPHKVKEIKPKNTNLYKKLDSIIIDEISMVRADLLDCVDSFLKIHGRMKKRPFGGIQMIFIGDLYQLPPVVTSREKPVIRDFYRTHYFFDARVFKECEFEFVELEKVYRHHDREFLEILNAIRNNTVTDEIIERLNRRVLPDFIPDENDFYIYLTTTNKMAEKVNYERLSKIESKEFKYHGFIDGEFTDSELPTSPELILKVDAQVMLLNNDSKGRWINGDIGKIVDIKQKRTEPDIIFVELSDGQIVEVTPFTWEMFEFYYDTKKKKILTEVVGQFTQYPLKLAWAITIHKSQGLTFDRVIVDIGRGTFSHGQLYVALSRCRSLDGIILKKPVSKRHILVDRTVVRFITQFQYRNAEKSLPLKEKIKIIENAIKNGKTIEIVYLKSSDVKSKRVVRPLFIGKMDYKDKSFLGLKAFCTLRKQERNFNVEKILSIKPV